MNQERNKSNIQESKIFDDLSLIRAEGEGMHKKSSWTYLVPGKVYELRLPQRTIKP